MQNYFDSYNNKTYNPIVEGMFSNYLRTYGNETQKRDSGEFSSENNAKNMLDNTKIDENENNSTNLEKNQNIASLAKMLNTFGQNKGYNEMINLLNKSGVDKNQLMLNLISSLGNKQSKNSSKTSENYASEDFSNLISVDDYNFVD